MERVLFDISRVIKPKTAVWPGDQPFKQNWTMRKEEGASVNLSSVRMSLHTATHADAPLHVRSSGASIADLALNAFLGPAYVLDLTEHPITDGFIQPVHLERVPPECTRVLLKTRHSLVPTTAWDANWWSISPAAVEWCAQHGLMLIGTDAPSVDPEESKTLDAHHALARVGIVHLEHLWLREVPEGTYTIAALPLKIADADAAPVRAVLYRGI